MHQICVFVCFGSCMSSPPGARRFGVCRSIQVWSRRRSRVACADYRGRHMSGGEAAERPLKRLRTKTSIAEIRAQQRVLLPLQQSEVLSRPSNSPVAKGGGSRLCQ